MSGWGYLVLLVVFLALSWSMRLILSRKVRGKVLAEEEKNARSRSE